jgi:excisionase family DNA binding protein
MNANQLRTYLIENLKLAEPLDSESTLPDPQHVATVAAKKLALLGYGGGALMNRAYKVESAQECATILAECLRLLPDDEPDLGNGELLTVEQAAARMSISPRTIYRLVDAGELAHVRMGRAIRISPDSITEYQQCNRQQGESLFR